MADAPDRWAEGPQRIHHVAVHRLSHLGELLFGAKYVSTTIRTAASAFTAKLDAPRIRLIRA
jgi:hypothetical protein